jgi:hypothetical protein
MLDLPGTGSYTSIHSIDGIFAGVSLLYEDKEICEKLINTIKKLVENDILSAKDAEQLIRKYFPKLIEKPKRPLITFVGPFWDPINKKSIAFDMSRMGKDWIHKYTKATPEEREEMVRPHHNE